MSNAFEMSVKFITAQKMKFFIKDFFSKCDQTQETADLVTFTEEILNSSFFVQCIKLQYMSTAYPVELRTSWKYHIDL